MCKVAAYVVTDVMMSVISYFYMIIIIIVIFHNFNVDIKSKIIHSLTSSTHLLLKFSSSSSGSVVIPTPHVTGGN